MYSTFLARVTGLEAPFEQYGLYGTGATGFGVMCSSFWRAHQLSRYVQLKNQPGRQDEALLAADLARVRSTYELDRAARTIARLQTRGVLAVVGLPALWLGYRLTVHNVRESQGKKS